MLLEIEDLLGGQGVILGHGQVAEFVLSNNYKEKRSKKGAAANLHLLFPLIMSRMK